MDTIFTEIRSMDASFAVASNAVEEQAAGGSQILTALKTIQDMTGQVRDGAAMIQQQSGSIHQEMATLRQISQEVTKQVQEVRLAGGTLLYFWKTLKISRWLMLRRRLRLHNSYMIYRLNWLVN